MNATIKRPGGELSSRPLHFFWIADCSGSMYGDKIQSLNYAIRQAIPEMKSAAESNPNAQLLVRTLKFSSGAQWITPAPVEISDFEWENLDVEGLTDMGYAIDMVAEQLKIPPMSERALPPVLVLLSDGQPTDDYKSSFQQLNSLPWGKKAVKIAISIGQDVDDQVLEEFTGNRELILQANNSDDLVKMVKWASTVAKLVSAPASRTTDDVDNTILMDIPTASDSDEDIW